MSSLPIKFLEGKGTEKKIYGGILLSLFCVVFWFFWRQMGFPLFYLLLLEVAGLPFSCLFIIEVAGFAPLMLVVDTGSFKVFCIINLFTPLM